MMLGRKYINDDVIYMSKNHFCPNCHCKLDKVKVSKVVSSTSPEAKDYDFKMKGHSPFAHEDTYLIGDVEFTWKEFECPSCKKHLTIDEMKGIEGVDATKKSVRYKILYYAAVIVVLIITAILTRCF